MLHIRIKEILYITDTTSTLQLSLYAWLSLALFHNTIDERTETIADPDTDIIAMLKVDRRLTHKANSFRSA
jgi:hypothetical protein